MEGSSGKGSADSSSGGVMASVTAKIASYKKLSEFKKDAYS